jgi:uncharacterized protein
MGFSAVGELELLGRIGTMVCYPVKSMLGQPADTAVLTGAGLVGDRVFAVYDRDTAQVITGKSRVGSTLLQVQSGISNTVVWYQVPGGKRVACDDPTAGRVLSEFLGRDVRLVRADPLKSYETDDGFDLRYGVLVDSSPLHIVTSSSLQGLQIAGEQEDREALVRRFRPNIVIESDDDEYRQFPEHELVGKVLRVGDKVRLYVRKRTRRCALPGRGQFDLAPNPGLLRTIKAHTKNDLGVYAVVIEPGMVTKGDQVWAEDADD